MKGLKFYLLFLLLALILAGDIYLLLDKEEIIKLNLSNSKMTKSEDIIKLPQPRTDSGFSLEEALQKRRSVREYSDKSVSLTDLSQLLWAAQGKTAETGRTAPSAGGLYPIEIYVVGSFGEYRPGIYHYNCEEHSLERIKEGDFLGELSEIGLGQDWIKNASLNIVVTGVVDRTASKYGDRAGQYVALEAGHVGQNIYLQATALSLGTVSIGALYDKQMAEFLDFEKSQKAYYIFPVGHKKE